MSRWKNVKSTVTIKLDADESESIGLPPVAGELTITAKHSGYDDPGNYWNPPESDIEIHELSGAFFEDDNGNEVDVLERHYDAIWNGDKVYEKIIDKIMGYV